MAQYCHSDQHNRKHCTSILVLKLIFFFFFTIFRPYEESRFSFIKLLIGRNTTLCNTTAGTVTLSYSCSRTVKRPTHPSHPTPAHSQAHNSYPCLVCTATPPPPLPALSFSSAPQLQPFDTMRVSTTLYSAYQIDFPSHIS